MIVYKILYYMLQLLHVFIIRHKSHNIQYEYVGYYVHACNTRILGLCECLYTHVYVFMSLSVCVYVCVCVCVHM